MAKRITWSEQAKADLRAIDQQAAIQILRTLGRYAKTETGDVKQLRQTDPPLLRLRAQDHRIFFRNQAEHIEVLRILDRKDAYR